MTSSEKPELKEFQKLYAEILEVGDLAHHLEQLQYKLTEKLCDMAERFGFSTEDVAVAPFLNEDRVR